MENSIIRKRLNTFKTSEGRLRNVSDDVIIDVLRVWENWTGKAVDLNRELGLSKMQMATLLKKAKKLMTAGIINESDFREVQLLSEKNPSLAMVPNAPIEFCWDGNKVIRFSEVDLLVDFLKKSSA